VEWHDTPRGISAYIPTIEVLPERRGHGVGRELLQRLEQSARDAGAAAIELHVDTTNAGAIQLYESQGYRQWGARDNFYAQGRPAYLYKKEFAPGNQAQ
jgi:ribosomal-protein-alanine N-acetyltransferase